MTEQVVCNQKDQCQHKGCSHTDGHKEWSACGEGCLSGDGGIKGATCQPVPTDLTSPLRPLKGPDMYLCSGAPACGIEDCNAIEEHTHYASVIHALRRCGFIGHDVFCSRQPAPAPLQGVYFSGKAVVVLSLLKPYDPKTGEGMKPEDWTELWGMVTGKTDRLRKEALEIMADSNGPTESVAPKEWEKSVRAIIHEEYWNPKKGEDEWVSSAAARIVKLPRIRAILRP